MHTLGESRRETSIRILLLTALSLAITALLASPLAQGQVLQSLAVTPANSSVVVGGAQQFTAIGNYSDGSALNLTGSVAWGSTNSAAASIIHASNSNAKRRGPWRSSAGRLPR